MVVRIKYNDKIIATIGKGEKAILNCSGKTMLTDVSVSVEEFDTPEQLTVPTISLDGDTLTITATDNRTREFVIFVDGVETATTSDSTFDFSTLGLGAGTYSVTVKARASGYLDSPASNAVSYVVAGDTVQVSGTWRFNNIPKYSAQFILQTCNFTIEDGRTGTYIGIYTTGFYIVAIKVIGEGKGGYSTDHGWDSGYQTITFDGVQYVSKEFKEWLDANAVQQTIGFTIAGTAYFADVGMTWGEWVNSAYNTGDYIVENNYIKTGVTYVYLSGVGSIAPTAKILANTEYELRTGGGGN